MNALDHACCWHAFQGVASDAEAAAYSQNCIFSLATLELACRPHSTTFALTERKQPDVWRWAIIDASSRLVEEGWEPTQAAAKQAAENALQIPPSQPTMCH